MSGKDISILLVEDKEALKQAKEQAEIIEKLQTLTKSIEHTKKIVQDAAVVC